LGGRPAQWRGTGTWSFPRIEGLQYQHQSAGEHSISGGNSSSSRSSSNRSSPPEHNNSNSVE
jgi:hypothetical protein